MECYFIKPDNFDNLEDIQKIFADSMTEKQREQTFLKIKQFVEQIKGDYQGEQVIANEFNTFTWALEPGDIFRLLALPFASCLTWEKIFSLFVHKFPHLQ